MEIERHCFLYKVKKILYHVQVVFIGDIAKGLNRWRMYFFKLQCTVDQCFSTFVRPRPGKFFFYKTTARSQQIYS